MHLKVVEGPLDLLKAYRVLLRIMEDYELSEAVDQAAESLALEETTRTGRLLPN